MGPVGSAMQLVTTSSFGEYPQKKLTIVAIGAVNPSDGVTAAARNFGY